MAVDPQDRASFYRVAALGLRVLEARVPERPRLGPSQDARWGLFKGDGPLTVADRFDLAIREAAVEYPLAFAPRVVFALTGLTDDEPFGPTWGPVDARTAEAWLRDDEPLPGDGAGVVARAAAAWRLDPLPSSAEVPASLSPSSRVVAAGVGALIALVAAFASTPGTDFAAQVSFVARRPAERQLFGLAGLVLGARATRCLEPAQATAENLGAAASALTVVTPDVPDAVPDATADALRRWLAGA